MAMGVPDGILERCPEDEAQHPGPSPRSDDARHRQRTFVSHWVEAKLYLATYCRALLALVRGSPHILLLPFLLFALLTVAGEIGVHKAAQQFAEQKHQVAQGVVQAAAQQLSSKLLSVVSPNTAVALALKERPNIPSFAQRFPAIAQSLINKMDPESSIQRMTLTVWGVAVAVWPTTPAAMSVLGLNYFKDAGRVASVVSLIAQGPDATQIVGPVGILGTGQLGLVSPFAIFQEAPGYNATQVALLGLDKPFTVSYSPGVIFANFTRPNLDPACGRICEPRVINGTTYTYLGQVFTTVLTSTLIKHLDDLGSQAIPYKYAVVRVDDSSVNNSALQAAAYTAAASSQIVFKSPDSLGPPISVQDSPECSEMYIPGVGITWAVCIAPLEGWQPAWLLPLQIVIPFVSLAIAGMLFIMLASKRRHASLVELMLPKKVIQYLNLGRTYAEPFKDVTVLFSDIVSYTNMSSEMSANEVAELLNFLYSHFDTLVDKHGVYKVTTIGDGVMCVAGAPDPRDPKDAATRMARMALDMVDFARNYVHKDGRRLEIRVGMYTGDVVAAVVGKKMPHWCLVGDTVNVSSRMESHSVAMHVHVSATTAKLLEGNAEFTLQPRGKIQVKGKGPMSTFFLWRAGEEPQPLPASIGHSESFGPPSGDGRFNPSFDGLRDRTSFFLIRAPQQDASAHRPS